MPPASSVIVLSEASERLPPSASARDIHASTEAARLAGCRIYSIPPDLADSGVTAADALAYLPDLPGETPGVWVGYIPTPERYAELYAAALAKNVRLPNTPAEHRNAQEFDAAYPRLEGLTPYSVIVKSPAEVPDSVARLGLPVFLKGAVQSRKSRGWKACVAETTEEAETLTAHLLALENRSRGRVVLRRLVRLRHTRTAPGTGFPLGREFRVFVYRGGTVGLGYYWEGEDPLMRLSDEEERTVRGLALEAARRVGSPYIAVDIGQTESGDWIVIETGDAQFSGVSQIPLLGLWNRLRQAMIASQALTAGQALTQASIAERSPAFEE
jgi:hypothetical protein